MRDLTNEDAEVADRLLSGIVPPAGRADITITQRLALANAHAVLALAAELRTANKIQALRLGASVLEPEDTLTIKSAVGKQRAARRNLLRAGIRSDLGLGAEK